ncbi:helix-turn-helix domain-containing protein [Thioalkalivibrio nitratireducens]|nr:AraC family transcriptional regulator [Thioalkalivibrio nitratireducens]
MLEFFTRGREAPSLEESRARPDLAVQMLENAHPPGDLATPPIRELMLSQAVGRPFRHHSDIGAGPFSGCALPGAFVIIPPRVAGRCHMRDPARMRFLGIPADLACDCLECDPNAPLDFGRLHAMLHQDPLITQALDVLWQEMERDDPAAHLFIDSMISAVVVRLARLSEQTRDIDACRGGLAPHQSARVIEYMHANLDQRITLRDLAGLTGLSPWHFARAFRHNHGLPPHRYLTRLRIQHARNLLTRTSLPVTAVAAATGYSLPQLARHFRQAVGITPSEYRQQIHHGSSGDPEPSQPAVIGSEPQDPTPDRKILKTDSRSTA